MNELEEARYVLTEIQGIVQRTTEQIVETARLQRELADRQRRLHAYMDRIEEELRVKRALVGVTPKIVVALRRFFCPFKGRK